MIPDTRREARPEHQRDAGAMERDSAIRGKFEYHRNNRNTDGLSEQAGHRADAAGASAPLLGRARDHGAVVGSSEETKSCAAERGSPYDLENGGMRPHQAEQDQPGRHSSHADRAEDADRNTIGESFRRYAT